MEEEKKMKTVTVEVFGKELFLEPKDPDGKEIYKSCDTEEQVRKVKIVLWGEGMRLDCHDEAGDLLECHNALSAAADLFEIKVLDEGEIREIQRSDLGESIGKFDDEDPDFEKCDFKTGCSLYEPTDDGISQIDYIQTKIYGDIEVEVTAGKKFDPAKARLIWSEFVLPDSEEPVYVGLFYDGKQYPIELDIDSEREISTKPIWEE